jgi:hypothetical protein
MATPPTLNQTDGSIQINSQIDEMHGTESVTSMRIDPNGSTVIEDLSHYTSQDKFGNIYFTNSDGITHKTPNNYATFVEGNAFHSVFGDYQKALHGSDYEKIDGDKQSTSGEQGPTQVEAAKKLQEATRKIDDKKIDTIKKTAGTKVECPNCANEIASDQGMCLIELACKIIRIGIPNFPYPLDIIEKFLNFLGIPLLTPEPIKKLNGGKGCGSPGCKSGMVETMQKPIQTANEQAASDLKSQQKELEGYQKDMGKGGIQMIGPTMADLGIYAGHTETMNVAKTVATNDNIYHTNVFKLGMAEDKKYGLIPKTQGNCKVAVYSSPIPNPGSLFIQATEKLKVVVGSPGIDVNTTGKITVNGSWVDVSSAEGELNLYSNNLTTLKGKNIILDAKDRSGDSGIRLEADNTMVAGALSVSGDLAVKGSFVLDGGIHCTHITAPGERINSEPTGDAHQVHSGATWNNPVNGMQATIYDRYDKSLKVIGRDIYNTLSLGILRPAEIKTLIEETYHSILLAIPVDNTGLPTGFSIPTNAPAGSPAGGPLMVVGTGITSKGDAVVLTYAYVFPTQIIPVFNFPHNHNSPGNDHSHGYTGIQASVTGNTKNAREASPEPSHVPTPAKTSGIGTKPGHKSMGDLCIPCINLGGGKHGSSPASKYGLGNDPYGGTNYVQTDGTFTPDGNLVPPPSIDIGCVG